MLPAATIRHVDLTARVALSGDDDGIVHIEATALARAILNLVENAIRHSPRGSTVTVEGARDGGCFTLSVMDQGAGVEPALAERLFERFAQGSTGRGTMGIGLFYCKLTADKWHGRIGQVNLPGGGCRFWLELPAFGQVADA